MIVLKEMTRDIIDTARKRADAKNPPFTDQHQGVSVIAEEIIECDRELKKMKRNLNKTFMCVFNDKEKLADKRVERIEEFTINLMAEAAQVAAMCEKFKDIRAGKDNPTLCCYEGENIRYNELRCETCMFRTAGYCNNPDSNYCNRKVPADSFCHWWVNGKKKSKGEEE